MTYSRATGSENYRLLSVAGSRVLPVTEKSAVPIPTGMKPASNPGLTTGSPVTENCRFRSVAGSRVLLVTEKQSGSDQCCPNSLVTASLPFHDLAGQTLAIDKRETVK